MGEEASTQLSEVRKTIVLNAPLQRVWQAVATSEGLAGWWMPNTFAPEVGREFVLHTGAFGDSRCKVTELDPPRRVAFDWDKDWHLLFALKDLGEGKTEFTLIHSGWDATKTTSTGQPHAVIRNVMNNGWESLVKEKLRAYVED